MSDDKAKAVFEYGVLCRNDMVEDDAWFFLGSIKARRKEDAISAVCDAYDGGRRLDGDGTVFRVVPMSSWKDEYTVILEAKVRKSAASEA